MDVIVFVLGFLKFIAILNIMVFKVEGKVTNRSYIQIKKNLMALEYYIFMN